MLEFFHFRNISADFHWISFIIALAVNNQALTFRLKWTLTISILHRFCSHFSPFIGNKSTCLLRVHGLHSTYNWLSAHFTYLIVAVLDITLDWLIWLRHLLLTCCWDRLRKHIGCLRLDSRNFFCGDGGSLLFGWLVLRVRANLSLCRWISGDRLRRHLICWNSRHFLHLVHVGLLIFGGGGFCCNRFVGHLINIIRWLSRLWNCAFCWSCLIIRLNSFILHVRNWLLWLTCNIIRRHTNFSVGTYSVSWNHFIFHSSRKSRGTFCRCPNRILTWRVFDLLNWGSLFLNCGSLLKVWRGFNWGNFLLGFNLLNWDSLFLAWRGLYLLNWDNLLLTRVFNLFRLHLSAAWKTSRGRFINRNIFRFHLTGLISWNFLGYWLFWVSWHRIGWWYLWWNSLGFSSSRDWSVNIKRLLLLFSHLSGCFIRRNRLLWLGWVIRYTWHTVFSCCWISYWGFILFNILANGRSGFDLSVRIDGCLLHSWNLGILRCRLIIHVVLTFNLNFLCKTLDFLLLILRNFCWHILVGAYLKDSSEPKVTLGILLFDHLIIHVPHGLVQFESREDRKGAETQKKWQ